MARGEKKGEEKRRVMMLEAGAEAPYLAQEGPFD
jgi:hypothetical protein